MWLGEREGEANEGLVTVGSRKEKKLCDNECLCYRCQLLVPTEWARNAHMVSSALARFGVLWR